MKSRKIVENSLWFSGFSLNINATSGLTWLNEFFSDIVISRLAICYHVSRKCSTTISHALLIRERREVKAEQKVRKTASRALLLVARGKTATWSRGSILLRSLWAPCQSTHVHAPRPNTANTCRCALSSRILCGYWSDLCSRSYSWGIFGAPKFMDVFGRRHGGIASTSSAVLSSSHMDAELPSSVCRRRDWPTVSTAVSGSNVDFSPSVGSSTSW